MVRGSLPLTIGSEAYKTYDDVGAATGAYLAQPGLAKYKFHVDLGGGGGTTWTGTLEKFAMSAGCLMCVTFPYFNYPLGPLYKEATAMVPRPGTPVTSPPPKTTSTIARGRGSTTSWCRTIRGPEGKVQLGPKPSRGGPRDRRAGDGPRPGGTPEGFGRLFEEDFVGPMRRIIEAYRPVSPEGTGDEGGGAVEEGVV
ncbi:LOW QUALITY PROTEIN: hypothetical protein ACHAWF_012716 [Thalassiosira exigua]